MIRLRASGRRQFDYAVDVTVDAALGIRTFIPVPTEPIDTRARNGRYEPLPYRAMRTIERHLDLSTEDELLDLGCGKGRVLCLFAAHRLAKCTGVEVSSELAAEAEANANRMHFRRAPIEIVTADAAEAEIGGASIVFMYNPFSAEVMRPVLAHIYESLRAAPRPLKICYANPVEASVLDECPWLERVDEFVVTHNGWRAAPVTIWTACLDLVGDPANDARSNARALS